MRSSNTTMIASKSTENATVTPYKPFCGRSTRYRMPTGPRKSTQHESANTILTVHLNMRSPCSAWKSFGPGASVSWQKSQDMNRRNLFLRMRFERVSSNSRSMTNLIWIRRTDGRTDCRKVYDCDYMEN